MSIATDVSRIKGNITAALDAIADKGVTVPDGSTSDAMAALIEAIEAGGGGNVLVGSFTPSEDVHSFSITHNLGTIPTFACWTLSDKKSSVGFAKKDALAGVAWGNTTTQLNIYNGDDSTSVYASTLYGKFHTSLAITYGIAANGVSWAKANLTTISAATDGYFRAGKTYQYIILGE